MTGQYEYIFRHYGVRPAVGGRVEHTVTGEFGTILKEGETHKHYVQVRFDGCEHPGLCHPLELDFLAPDEIETGSATSTVVDGVWVPWEGGECPVAPDALVDIKLDNGNVVDCQPAGSKFWEAGKEFGQQIVGYRLTGSPTLSSGTGGGE